MKILIGYDGSSSANAAIEDLRKAGLPPQAEALVVCVADGNLPAIESGAIDSASEDSWKSRACGGRIARSKGRGPDRLLLSAMDCHRRGVMGISGQDHSGYERVVASRFTGRRFARTLARRAIVSGQRVA